LTQVSVDGALHRLVSGPGTRVDTPRRTSWAPYSSGWEAFEDSLSSNSRSWLRRKRRKLEQGGSVAVDVVDPLPGEVPGALERLERVEAASWKGRAGTAIAQDPWQQRQLGDYVRLAAGRGAVRFFFLQVAGADVAAHLYAVDGGRLWQLKIGYDEAWAAASPGIVLMHEVHRHACEQGLEACEYLGRAEGWQERWPVVHREHVRLQTYPMSVSGLAHRARDGAKRARERARSRQRARAEARTRGARTVGAAP
jgi:CelD/BcsL family acetyltransferase involved in cellulose biosynthesis